MMTLPTISQPLVPLLLTLAALAATGARAQAPEGRGADRLPNVVLILADDLGYGDLGAYGNRVIRTPRLDRMAAEGTRFTQFYAGSTICAPSRAVLLTGLHAGHATVRNNVTWPRGDAPLLPSDVTIAEALSEAGYTSGAFGKWALGLGASTGSPARQGFDAFFGYEDQSEAHDYYVPRLQRIEGGSVVDVDVDSTRYSHDVVMDEALDFIRENRDRPFFAYLAVAPPHKDLVVPPEALAPYLDRDGQSVFQETRAEGAPNATYAAMVSVLDQGVGEVLDLLAELGLDHDTVVLFTSDNGSHAEQGHDPAITGSSGLLRGTKRDLYEGGIRVPMIAWGPGRVPAGAVSEHVWAAYDVLPTLADLAGAPVPAGVDGISVEDALTGSGPAPTHEALYWEWREPAARGGEFLQAVRAGDWKLLRFTDASGASRVELYDLRTDLAETTDVAAERPEVAARLAAHMARAHVRPVLPDFWVPGVDSPR